MYLTKDDITGEPLVQRADDNVETLKKRLEAFHKNTQPVVNYYQKKGILSTIDASKSCDDVYATIKAVSYWVIMIVYVFLL